MKNIFIIGSKGIPAKYGGFETFVDKLTEYRKNDEIMYHVSCMGKDYDEFEYNLISIDYICNAWECERYCDSPIIKYNDNKENIKYYCSENNKSSKI